MSMMEQKYTKARQARRLSLKSSLFRQRFIKFKLLSKCYVRSFWCLIFSAHKTFQQRSLYKKKRQERSSSVYLLLRRARSVVDQHENMLRKEGIKSVEK